MRDTVTREDHMEWVKERALQYVDDGDVQNAFASLVSDLNKHSETVNHGATNLGMMLMLGGHLSTPEQMREFIEGVN